MARNMGLGILGNRDICFRQKHRWMFRISNDAGSGSVAIGDQQEFSTTPVLPPSKGARPVLELKEMEVRHYHETIYYPGRPDWKPLNITVYHIGGFSNDPIWDWLNLAYNPYNLVKNSEGDTWNPPISGIPNQQLIKKHAYLDLYDGCGNVLETWAYDSVWPQNVDWGTLEMDSSDLVYIDVTLRYARAYLVAPKYENF